jgi:hypothetical protein
MECKGCGNTEFERITVVTGVDVGTKGGLNIGLFNIGVESDAKLTTVSLKACKKCGLLYYNC